jgi:hypothetical protein
MRDCPFSRVDATHIMMLRDRKVKAGLPGAANNRRKYLGSMFSWAIEERKYGLKVNPCRDAKKAATVSEGYHTWTVDEVLKFIERHPLGTTAYLAMCLMLFLGGRRQDAIRLGPKNIRTVALRQSDGSNIHQRSMVYVPRKTRYRRMDESVKPILPPLDEALRATAHGLKTFLVTAYGEPYMDGGFGNRMREWCDQAELPAMHRARVEEGGGNDLRRTRRRRSADDGAFRLDQREHGDALHQEGQPGDDGSERGRPTRFVLLGAACRGVQRSRRCLNRLLSY